MSCFVFDFFFERPTFELCFEGFKPQNIDRRTRLEKSYPTNYFLSPTELRSPSYGRFCVRKVFVSYVLLRKGLAST